MIHYNVLFVSTMKGYLNAQRLGYSLFKYDDYDT